MITEELLFRLLKSVENTPINDENLSHGLKNAVEHKLGTTIKRCIKYMKNTLNKKNMWDFWKLARKYDSINIVIFNKIFNS